MLALLSGTGGCSNSKHLELAGLISELAQGLGFRVSGLKFRDTSNLFKVHVGFIESISVLSRVISSVISSYHSKSHEPPSRVFSSQAFELVGLQ